MFFQEIQPGLLLSSEQNIHIKLAKCPFCSSAEVPSHLKYTDRCIDCGNLYNLYTVRRNSRKNYKMTLKTAKAHYKVLQQYVEMRNAGYNTPRTLDEELVATTELLQRFDEDARRRRDSIPVVDITCRGCGVETTVRLGELRMCTECSARRSRYDELYYADALDQDECDEFADLIRYYIKQRERVQHFDTPQITRGIKRLKERALKIGCEPYKLYV